jgi:hypothetical protein
VHEFESWAGVQADRAMQFDWDDAMGNKARREAGLRLEKMRQVRLLHIGFGCHVASPATGSGSAIGLA